MTQPSPTDDLEARITEALRIGAATGADGGLKYPSNVYVILRDTLAALRPAGVGEVADPRYEVDVQYEVWCGLNMEAASDDLNEARRYEAQYQPCSLLKATTYRQPVGLPDATPAHPDAALMERVRTVLPRFIEITEDLDDAGPLGEGWQSAELMNLLAEARALLSDLKAEAGR